MYSKQYDLIVVGGGIAGVMAAVAAARQGSRTLLVEEQGCLGGSLTSCGTGPMMTFHAGDTQVIQGLPEELIGRLKKKGLSPGHVLDSTGYTYTVTPFDVEGMKHELELMALEAGVEILFHTMLEDAVVKDSRLSAVRLLSCGQSFMTEAFAFIDATGDADLLYRAGVPCRQGDERTGKDQPMTMNFRLDGVDINLLRRLMETDVDLFPLLAPKSGIQKMASRLSCSGFQDIMRKGMDDGELTFDRDIVLFFETNTEGEVIVNMSRVNGKNPVDPCSLSLAEIEGRRQVWELYSFLRRRIPGFSRARLMASGPNIGIRSSRRMCGIYSLTAMDILEQRRFDDAVACCGYPIDIHSSDGVGTDSRFLPEGTWYTIPYRCLVNDSVPNLMAAGRNVSCDFDAHASLRVSPCCAALGQAAGTAVALAIQSACNLLDLNIRRLREKLQEDGAFV